MEDGRPDILRAYSVGIENRVVGQAREGKLVLPSAMECADAIHVLLNFGLQGGSYGSTRE